jgi:hypothetical protein
MAQVVDRAVVIRNGRIVAELTGSEITPHRLARLSHADEPSQNGVVPQEDAADLVRAVEVAEKG